MRYGLTNTTKVILLIWSPGVVASVVSFENVKVMSLSEIYRLWSIVDTGSQRDVILVMLLLDSNGL